MNLSQQNYPYNASLNTESMTGGRLNAADSVACAILDRPYQDADGDGVQNVMEYITGTKVDDVASKPALTSGVAGGQFTIRMPRVVRPEAYGVIETSSTLNTWTPVGVTDTSSTTGFIGRIPVTSDKGFLRIRPVVSR